MIAETGAGQHGVATATVAARFGMECVVYMGSEDVKRQAQNVFRMKLLGATVVPVESGSKTLKDALNEAMRDWVTNVDTTFYIIGTVAGPHPYPMMVRDFQSVIGRECLTQMPEAAGSPARCGDRVRRRRQQRDGHLPRRTSAIPTCGSIGVEAAGEGIATGRHAASLIAGRPGVLHGNRTYLLQDADGQISRDAFDLGGARLSGRRPRARMAEGHRARRIRVGHRRRGARGVPRVLPHRGHHSGARVGARARVRDAGLRRRCARDRILLVNLSGRGDKDMTTVAERANPSPSKS